MACSVDLRSFRLPRMPRLDYNRDMTNAELNAALKAHRTCRQTGIDCAVPHCSECDGAGDYCEGACEGTGQARCECGALAVQFVTHSERGREGVCAACPLRPDYDEPEAAPPVDDADQTARIVNVPMAEMVFGEDSGRDADMVTFEVQW